MLISLLSNVGIIFMNVYLIWKMGGGFTEPQKFTLKQVIQFIILESLVGISLIVHSLTVLEIRFDFRVIMFALSMKYLGAKVTLPTILFVALARFLFDGVLIALLYLMISIIFIVTIQLVFEWSKKFFKGRGQLLTIIYYYLLLTFPLIYYGVGDVRHFAIFYSVILLLGTLLTLFVHSVMEDVERLSNLSIMDGLTDLYNTRKLHQDLEQFSKHRRRYALVVLDIDNFKHYNDTFGHLVGDKVIREVSKSLKNVPDNQQIFYRYGGEEFVAIIGDDDKKAYKIATQLQEEIQGMHIVLENGEKLKVTVSIGVAFRTHQEPLMSTFNRADKALYIAKVNGKDQIVIV